MSVTSPPKDVLDNASIGDLKNAVFYIYRVLNRLNNRSDKCDKCGVTHYENWAEHQDYERLEGTIKRLSGIVESLERGRSDEPSPGWRAVTEEMT